MLPVEAMGQGLPICPKTLRIGPMEDQDFIPHGDSPIALSIADPLHR